MMAYTTNFPIRFDPLGHPDAVVMGPQVRFTVLTPRLLRLEYSPTELFEDRPSQVFWHRGQPAPEFELKRDVDHLEIETAYLVLRYVVNQAGFSGETLTITFKETGAVWHYGQSDPLNLLGTARTLDHIDGGFP